MRYSRQHKQETHHRLLKKAAEEFRRNGVQGTEIAPLMRRLGLTHGGFYAHFDSKNELIAEATGPMFEDALSQRMLAAAEAAPKGKAIQAIVTHYLSPQHRDSREGCALAGLAGEMARQTEPVRNAYISALNHRLKRIAALLPGDDEKASGHEFRGIENANGGPCQVSGAHFRHRLLHLSAGARIVQALQCEWVVRQVLALEGRVHVPPQAIDQR